MTKEEWAAYMREYRKKNPEKCREQQRESYFRHRKARLDYKKKWREKRYAESNDKSGRD